MSKRKRPVKQINPLTGEVVAIYSSTSFASRVNGAHQSHIAMVLQGRVKHFNGYKFEYADIELDKV